MGNRQGDETIHLHQYTAENCPGRPCGNDCDHKGMPPMSYAKKAFTVIEQPLSDNSKVYSVQGSSDLGGYLIVIDCDREEVANKLADLLSNATFGVHVQSK